MMKLKDYREEGMNKIIYYFCKIFGFYENRTLKNGIWEIK